MRILSVCQFVNVDGRARAAGKLAMPGDMVGVIVRLDHRRHPQALLRRHVQNIVHHIYTRINDRAHTGSGTANDVAGTTQVFFDQLLEVHTTLLYPAPCHASLSLSMTWGCFCLSKFMIV